MLKWVLKRIRDVESNKKSDDKCARELWKCDLCRMLDVQLDVLRWPVSLLSEKEEVWTMTLIKWHTSTKQWKLEMNRRLEIDVIWFVEEL